MVSAVAAGSATITALVEGKSGTSAITVTAANADVCSPGYVPPTQPPVAGGVDVTVTRLDGGCGSVLVSNAIPLAPGALTAAQTSQLRLYVGGAEQALYVEALKGTHPGGSLRSVLVQFNYALAAGKPVKAQLVLGQARGTTDIAKPNASRTNPVAVALPTNPTYLMATLLVGPTISVAATKPLSATHARFENDFVTYADKQWVASGASWVEDYYDRALVYYAAWVRSGNLEYWKRATAIVIDYRTQYLEPNTYNSSPHWAQMEGVEKHYLTTGDESSRFAVARVAERLRDGFQPTLGNIDSWWDGRIQARLLQSYLLAWRLEAQGAGQVNWAAMLDDALTKILNTQQADGSYRFISLCNESLNFMTGMLNDVLITYHAYYKADARIQPSVKKAVDFLWSSQWISTAKSFKYVSNTCADVGGPTAAPDLNNMIINGFAWTYKQTGDVSYRTAADAILTGAVEGAWLDGSKQFNQQYTTAYRYLSYRQ